MKQRKRRLEHQKKSRRDIQRDGSGDGSMAVKEMVESSGYRTGVFVPAVFLACRPLERYAVESEHFLHSIVKG